MGDSVPEMHLLQGFVVEANGHQRLENVHVVNRQWSIGTLTNQQGCFAIPMGRFDTIAFTAVGHRTVYFLLNQAQLPEQLEIMMPVDTICLLPFELHGLPTYQEFIHQIVHFDKPLPEAHIAPFARQLFTDFKPGEVSVSATGPFTLLYERYNKSSRFQRKLERNRKKYGYDPFDGEADPYHVLKSKMKDEED